MKKQLLLTRMLLLVALLVGSTSVWAEEETIASFTASTYNGGTTNNWTMTGNPNYSTSGGGYYQLVANTQSIVTPSINWSNYENITITIGARTYNGPNDTQKKITVKQGDSELTNYSPSKSSIVNSAALSITPTGTSTLSIACLGASDNTGCGVQTIVIKGEPATPAYKITPAVNDDVMGEVALVGSIITATPNSGYRVKADDEGYSITYGTASVEHEGHSNTFTVNPSSDCTITINFEVIPSHNVTWDVNGVKTLESYKEGEDIEFPVNPEGIGGKAFAGWVSTPIDGTTDDDPTFITEAVMNTSDIVYYAVFAKTISTPASLTKMGKGDSFTSNDKIVIVAEGGSKSYGLYQETVSSSYVKYFEFDGEVSSIAADNKNWLTVSAGTNGKWKIGDSTNGYLYNASSNNLSVDKNNATEWTLTDNNDGTFKLGNGKYISCRSDLNGDNQFRFRMAGGTPAGIYNLDIYKYNAGGMAYSAYCTTIPSTVSSTITEAGWNTFSSNYALDLSTITGGTAYVATTVDNTEVTMTKTTAKIAAGTGIMIKGAPNAEFTIGVTSDSPTLEDDNQLVGLPNGGTVAANEYNFVFAWKTDDVSTAGFYYVDIAAPTLPAGKAYLNSEGVNGAKLSIVIDDTPSQEETDGIRSIENSELRIENSDYYNLAGQKVGADYKGIVIVNGKKIVRK